MGRTILDKLSLMLRNLRKLWKNEAGVTAIEYALIGSLIAVVIVTAVTAIGGSLSSIFHTIAVKL
jgi:pilus assembly protein Flp/PilA